MKRRFEKSSIVPFLLSLFIVALGQPARIGWLSAVAAALGFSLFFYNLPKEYKFLVGTIWFTAVQLIQLSWMTSIEFQGYYILFVYSLVALGMGAQFGLLTLVVPSEGTLTYKKILLCAALWTLMEWSRLLLLCGFSWNPIGLALTHFIPSLQFSSVFGVLGLSFWAIFSNLSFLNVLRSRMMSKKLLHWALIAAVPYIFGLIQLNQYRASSKAEKKKLDVALIQTDLLPSEKSLHSNRIDDFISPFEQWKRILKFLKEKQMARWDMIVLPEAAVPMPSDWGCYSYAETRKELVAVFGSEAEKKFPPLCLPFAEQRYFQNEKIWFVSNLFWCQALANLYDAEVIAGLDHSDRVAGKNFNSAFYFKPNSFSFERYDKQILMPLAEYLPFEFLRPWTKDYGIHDFFSHGEGAKVFGKKVLFSPSICYEETFSEVMRSGRVKGAELFVNMTNDNYYPHSSLHEQHLFHSRLRAVENGIPLIRACNSGITAVVDCFGRVLATFDTEGPRHMQDGVLNCQLTRFHFPTLFSFWGEGGIISLCLILCLWTWRMKLSQGADY
jgi:apolipoprotein N-acyltransferase